MIQTHGHAILLKGQRYALESGVTTVNGKIAKPDTIIRDGDRIE